MTNNSKGGTGSSSRARDVHSDVQSNLGLNATNATITHSRIYFLQKARSVGRSIKDKLHVSHRKADDAIPEKEPWPRADQPEEDGESDEGEDFPSGGSETTEEDPTDDDLVLPWLTPIAVNPSAATAASWTKQHNPLAIVSTYFPASVSCSNPEENLYFQPSDDPCTITEASRAGGIWVERARVKAPDVRAFTPLATLSLAGNKEVQLFYLTKSETIMDLIWSPKNGWSAGHLRPDTAPKVSPWSSLSALRSANCGKLYYQRGTKICELSYDFGNLKPRFRELDEADPGTPITSTSYAGKNGTVYHVFYQRKGVLWDFRTQRSRRKSTELSSLASGQIPRNCTSISAFSWVAKQPHIRLYCASEDGRIVELLWDEPYGMLWDDWAEVKNGSGNLTELALPNLQPDRAARIWAMQMNRGGMIRVYYFSSGKEPVEVAFSKNSIEPRIRAIVPASQAGKSDGLPGEK